MGQMSPVISKLELLNMIDNDRTHSLLLDKIRLVADKGTNLVADAHRVKATVAGQVSPDQKRLACPAAPLDLLFLAFARTC